MNIFYVFAALTALIGLDVITTIRVLQAGGRELNPVTLGMIRAAAAVIKAYRKLAGAPEVDDPMAGVAAALIAPRVLILGFLYWLITTQPGTLVGNVCIYVLLAWYAVVVASNMLVLRTGLTLLGYLKEKLK